MKFPSLSRSALALVFMSLAGMLAPVASADQTYTISVPQRGLGAPPPPETSLVKMRIEGTGVGVPAPTVNGVAFFGATSTCDVDATHCSGLASFNYGGATPMNTGIVKRVSANRIDLSFDLKKDFEGEDRCGNLAAGVPTARTITLVLPGVSSAATYRMSSYTVPERASAKCDVAFRRVDTNRPTAAFTGTGSATNAGRLPLDLVLVLDKSGSMGGGFSGGASTPSRMARLQTSVGLFVDLWQSTETGVQGSPDDRMGLVSFDSSATAIALDGANLFKSRGASTTSWDIVKTKTNALAPGGSTSIGGGLNTGFETIASLAAQANDPTMVLFTDGEQNTSPMLSTDRPTVLCPTTLPCTAASPAPNFRIIEKSIPVLSVGLGGSSTFFSLLDNIALETAGRTRLVKDETLMDAAFISNLVSALKGNTLSLNSQAIGDIGAAEPASAPLTSSIDGSVTRVSFAMSWSGGNGESAELLVTGPGGANLNPTLNKRGAFYRVLTYDVTGPAEIGDWHASVVRLRAGANNPPLKYQISVVPVEGKLSYAFFDSARLGTGVPVTMRAELGWEGKALPDLPAGAIKVTIERPGENFGNILHDSTVTGDPKTNTGDTQDALSAKIDQLTASANLLGRTEPKPLPDTIELTHKGNGIYEGTFDKATVGGQYRLRFDLAWTDPRTDKISRMETLERNVPVVATAADSVTLTQIAAGTATILITPKDHFGNFAGPGYAPLFDVQVTGGGTAVLPLVDATSRGEYTLQITGIPAGADPQVKVVYGGATIRDEVLSKFDTVGGGSTTPPCTGLACIPWWVWLLIFILIVLFLLLRRRSTP